MYVNNQPDNQHNGNKMTHITDQLKWPDIPERLIKESEALVYINKVQAQFPRLQIFQLSFDLDGYVVAGKCGVLKKEQDETNES